MVCRVSPPPVQETIRRIPYKFNCKINPPLRDDVDVPCVACGHEIRSDNGTGTKYNKYECRKCKRPAHTECIDRLRLKPKFSCYAINQPLRDKGVLENPRPPINPKPLNQSVRCLICGEACPADNISRLTCSMKNCDYGAHEACAAVLFQVTNRDLISEKFKCDDVSHYLSPIEVTQFNTCLLYTSPSPRD